MSEPATPPGSFGAFSLNLFREGRAVKAWLAFAAGHGAVPDGAEAAELLHPNEAEYYRCLKSERRRRQYLLGRLVGKEAAALYLGEGDRRCIEITAGVFQQPVVRHRSLDTPAVTLSHSDDFAVAIAHEPGHIMGVDVERIDPGKGEVFRGHLTERERGLAPGRPCPREQLGGVMWTIKEALSKAIKCGLTVPFEILEIDRLTAECDGSLLSHFRHFGQYKAQSWLLPGFALSIALPRKTELRMDAGTFFDKSSPAAWVCGVGDT